MSAKEIFHSWIYLWLKPRSVIKGVIGLNLYKYNLLFAALSGVILAFGDASYGNYGDQYSVILIFALIIVLGPILGVILLYLCSFFLRWTGRFLGGKATALEIRTAIAWNFSMKIVLGVLFFIEFLIFGKELFCSYTPKIINNLFYSYLYNGFIFVEIILSLWILACFLIILAEVQNYSIYKAVLNLFLPIVIFIIPILLLLFAFNFITSNQSDIKFGIDQIK